MMGKRNDTQLDLFAAVDRPRGTPSSTPDGPRPLAPEAFDDETLIAVLPEADMTDATILAAEATRRRLTAAIPALERLCRRFAGFGLSQPVKEQVAALDALAGIGGEAAARAVAQIIAKGVVQGPTLPAAVAAAARLGVVLPPEAALSLLCHAAPQARADACRCVRFRPDIAAILIDLLGDLHQDVADQAALALGRMGQTEARPSLLRLLRDRPTAEAVDAIAEIADEEAVVVLGRIARAGTDLSQRAQDALAVIDHPVAARLRKALDTVDAVDTA